MVEKTWLTMITFVGVMVATGWIINRISNSSQYRNQNSLSYWSFYLIRLWTSQSIQSEILYHLIYDYPTLLHPFLLRNLVHGMQLRNSSTSLRLVLAAFIFPVFIISIYFTATFTSVLSIPSFKNSINSIEDLANSDSVEALLVKGSNSDEYIMVRFQKRILFVRDRL